MNIQGNIGWINVCRTDPSKSYVIGGSEEANEEIRNKFICWSAEMDIRYDKIFSIIDIKEENMKKRGEVLPFYKNVQKEGVILWKAA